MSGVHPFRILILAVLVAALTFAACFSIASCAKQRGPVASDDLAWLCSEFHLSEPELSRVRALHAGYLPKCDAMCARIAARNRELDLLLDGAKEITPAVEEKLAEVAALRAECQAQMLRHFLEVSRSLPAEQGKQYLLLMRRLTLDPRGGAGGDRMHPAHERP
jgi:hypothetical protein